MSHTPHELDEEFPESAALIDQLKKDDAHFANLVSEYHVINRAVHRVESRVEPMSEAEERALRHQRLHLKDQIAHMLAKATV